METPRQRRLAVSKPCQDTRPLISGKDSEKPLRRVQSFSNRTPDGEVKKLRKSTMTSSTSALPRTPTRSQKQQDTVKTIIDKARSLRKDEQELLVNLKQEITSLRAKAQKANQDATGSYGHIKRELPAIPSCCLRSCLNVLNLKEDAARSPATSSPVRQAPRSVGTPPVLPMEELVSWLESVHDELGCEVASNSPHSAPVVDTASNYKKLLETISTKDKRIHELVTSLAEMEHQTSSSSARLEEEIKMAFSYQEMNASQSELVELLKSQLSASEEGLRSGRVERENMSQRLKDLEDENRRLMINVSEQEVKFKSSLLEKDSENMKKMVSLKELLDKEIAGRKESESYCSQLKQDIEAKDSLLSSYAERLTESLHKLDIASNQNEDLTSKLQASLDKEIQTAAEVALWKQKFEQLQENVRPFREHLETLAKEKGILVEQNEEIFGKLSSASLVLASAMGHQNPRQKIKYVVKLQEELTEVKKQNAQLLQLISKNLPSSVVRESLTPKRKAPGAAGKSS